MPGSCLQAVLGITNSVGVCCMRLGWMAFPSMSTSFFFVPKFPLNKCNSGALLPRGAAPWGFGQVGAVPKRSGSSLAPAELDFKITIKSCRLELSTQN